MMSGMAARSLNLEGGKGVAFYDFKEIPSAKVHPGASLQSLPSSLQCCS